MRGFFILLLLSNIAYFSWQFFTAEQSLTPPVLVQSPGKQLVMLAELSDDERPSPRVSASIEEAEKLATRPAVNVAESTTKAESDMPMLCVRIDQIEEAQHLNTLLNLLKPAGAANIEQGEQAGVRGSYWVMLPPYSDKTAADASAKILTERQLRDFFIVRSGEYENAISLGVFSSEERARRRQQQVDGLGNNLPRARVERIELPSREYWLRYRVAAGKQPDLRQGIAGIGRLNETPCE